MKRVIVIYFILCMSLAFPLHAQGTKTITGIVSTTDTRGHKTPIIGAVVTTPTHNAGTQTDTNGAFSFIIPDSTLQLIISYASYAPDTISVPTGGHYTITLSPLHVLKEVVIRNKQKTTRLNLRGPIKTETIGKGELMKAACCNLSESFETTPSVDVAFTDAVSGYKQIMMLGLAGPYTAITRESIPDVHGLAAVTGLTYTPGTWIEGIQLSKGTGSVVNGYESVAGQINVELKKPFEGEKLFLNLYQSTQGRTEVNVQYRYAFNKRLSTNLFLHSASQWLKTDNNHDNFLDQPLGNRLIGMNRWYYVTPKGFELQAGIKGVYVDNTGGQWAYQKGTEQTVGNPWGYTLQTHRLEEWMKIGKIFDKPGTSIGLQLSGVYHNQQSTYGNQAYNATQKSYYANLIYQTYLFNTNNTFKTGASTSLDDYNEQFNTQQYTRNEVVPGAFAEYTYSYLEKFNVVAGMRGDYDNLYGGFATPRLHIRYAPFEKTTLRASLGRAQRTANIFAENMGLMASTRQFIIVSPMAGKAYGLNPEVAWSTGANLTQKFNLHDEEAVVSIDYYYTSFQNQVVVDMETPRVVQFYNLAGKSYAHSFQAQLDYEPVHNLNVRLAYRYYDVKTTYSGILKEKPLIPAHRAFTNIGYTTANNWKFDYTIQWIGEKRIPTLDDGNIPGRFSNSYIQMSAQVTKTINERLDIYAGCENITNYMQRDAIINPTNPFGADFDASMIWGPVMGRDAYIGVRYKIP